LIVVSSVNLIITSVFSGAGWANSTTSQQLPVHVKLGGTVTQIIATAQENSNPVCTDLLMNSDDKQKTRSV